MASTNNHKFIDADQLLQTLPDVPYKGSVRRILLQAPAADVAPVLRGQWEQRGCAFYCSHCQEPRDFPTWHYCPHCGSLNS